MNLETKLREAIEESGLSLREIARRAGVNVQVVMWIRDGHSIRTDKAEALMRVFGLRVADHKPNAATKKPRKK